MKPTRSCWHRLGLAVVLAGLAVGCSIDEHLALRGADSDAVVRGDGASSAVGLDAERSGAPSDTIRPDPRSPDARRGDEGPRQGRDAQLGLDAMPDDLGRPSPPDDDDFAGLDAWPDPLPPDAGPRPIPPDEQMPGAVCGNGLIEPGEICDDGNDVDVDLCDNTCQRARPPPGPYTPIFSTPSAAGNSPAMEEELLRLFQMAPRGAEVRVAMYEWSHTRFADGLGDALDRGADVRVVLDGGGPSAEVVARLQQRLGDDRVHRCGRAGHTACIGNNINHNKLFLFSELTDGSRWVVVQSSANLNAGQVNRHNNLMIVRGDRALYDLFRGYWDDLRAGRTDLNYAFAANGDLGTRAFFFPRESGDTLVGIFNNVHCEPGATIHVAMAFFTNPRVDVAEALAAKKRDGCEVRVIIGTYDSSPGPRVVSELRDARIPLRLAPREALNVHSKYFIINARFADVPGTRQLVFTGSHNFTGPAIRRNDETLLRVVDPDVYAAYLANWRLIWSQL